MKPVEITAGKLAERIDCPIEGDPELVITGVAPIEEAGPDELTFLANPRYRRWLSECRAGVIIVDEHEKIPERMTRILSDTPHREFRRALGILYPAVAQGVPEGIHPTAVIDPAAFLDEDVRIGTHVEVAAGARIGAGCVIFHGAYIGRDVIIGETCIIGVGSVLRHEVRLGNRVMVGDGSVIGFDGFGYVSDTDGYQKVPQVGTVEIADDVEIGAGCCIDRAAIGSTRIGRGSKLDNLIQVAHGVQIGEDTVIAAQTGISGSARIGSRVMMGGQVGLAGHIEIGDGMIIGARAGVTKSVDIKGMVSGYPARPQIEAMRIEASLTRLPELLKRVKALEERLKKSS